MFKFNLVALAFVCTLAQAATEDDPCLNPLPTTIRRAPVAAKTSIRAPTIVAPTVGASAPRTLKPRRSLKRIGVEYPCGALEPAPPLQALPPPLLNEATPLITIAESETPPMFLGVEPLPQVPTEDEPSFNPYLPPYSYAVFEPPRHSVATPIPEPSTLALMAAGLLIVGIRCRR